MPRQFFFAASLVGIVGLSLTACGSPPSTTAPSPQPQVSQTPVIPTPSAVTDPSFGRTEINEPLEGADFREEFDEFQKKQRESQDTLREEMGGERIQPRQDNNGYQNNNRSEPVRGLEPVQRNRDSD